MPASSANAISSRVLPTPENTIWPGNLDRERAAKLAFRHDVHACAEPSERGEHAEIGVGLDRIADRARLACQRRHRRRRGNDARESRSNNSRRAFLPRRRDRQDRPPRRGAHWRGTRRAGRRNGASEKGGSIRAGGRSKGGGPGLSTSWWTGRSGFRIVGLGPVQRASASTGRKARLSAPAQALKDAQRASHGRAPVPSSLGGSSTILLSFGVLLQPLYPPFRLPLTLAGAVPP